MCANTIHKLCVQHTAQEICQQKRLIPYPHRHHILPFMIHMGTEGYFWGVQDGCSQTDCSLKGDGKQRAWYGSCWLSFNGETCWKKQCESPAFMSYEQKPWHFVWFLSCSPEPLDLHYSNLLFLLCFVLICMKWRDLHVAQGCHGQVADLENSFSCMCTA